MVLTSSSLAFPGAHRLFTAGLSWGQPEQQQPVPGLCHWHHLCHRRLEGRIGRLVGDQQPNIHEDHGWLVVWNHGILWLSIYWECHNPNWRTHIFQRSWNHQPDEGFSEKWAGIFQNPPCKISKLWKMRRELRPMVGVRHLLDMGDRENLWTIRKCRD